MALKIGDKAPAFNLPTDGGGTLALKDLKGKKIVLYFYPKDNTSGCTKEAEAFRDSIRKFKTAGAEVVGVSKDSVKSHDSFKSKFKLPFTLVSDEDCELCKAYGVWVKKSMYGRQYMGIERATFLIDGKGKIGQIWHKVKIPGHAEEVLEAVKALK
ncbi:MAG: thioredoxin-dependent thiol peroxidase [Rhodospirillales bacterium]